MAACRLPALLAPYEVVHERAAADHSRRLSATHGVFEPVPATRTGGGSGPALAMLDAWIASTDRVGLLLGAAGAGKSTLLAEWTARRWGARTRPLPVPVRLALGPGGDDLRTILLHQYGGGDTLRDRAALELLLLHDQIVPCFDDFDALDPAYRSASMRSLLSSHGHVLVVARRDEFAGTLADPDAPGVRRISLAPFSPEQVEALVIRVHQATGDGRDVLRRISGIYDLADLMRQPLPLGMVLQTFDRLDPALHLDPLDVHDAYLRRWLDSLGDQAEPDALGFVEAVALTLFANGADLCPTATLEAAPCPRPRRRAQAPSPVRPRDG